VYLLRDGILQDNSLRMFMLSVPLFQNLHVRLLIVSLLFVNIVVWVWAFVAFGHSSALMAASLLAWCYGLRHAVDADHIAAIDNVTRKMMQQGKSPAVSEHGFRWDTRL
jgi:high-affinity nickel-transport protein